MDTALVEIEPVVDLTGVQRVINLALDAVASPRTRRDYNRALTDFMAYCQTNGVTALNKATVQAHITTLRKAGTPDSSLNQRLSAIRLFASEAADNGLIPEATAQSIKRIKSTPIRGRKLGNWLDAKQASVMLNATDDTLKGRRDRAILALMIGCGLRREEVAGLTVNHLAQRAGRWVVLDLVGKHNRTRTVPMAAWVKGIIDNWLLIAAITAGPLFPPIRRGGHIQPGAMTPQAIWDVVKEYSPVPNLAPHDLRRTFAKLAHTAGAPVEQIQQSLGHASIATTERYLGVELNLKVAPSDLIQLDV